MKINSLRASTGTEITSRGSVGSTKKNLNGFTFST